MIMEILANKLNDDIDFELTWRMSELDLYARPLRYSIYNTSDEENIYYKSLLAMLYAHFEGFCKFSFLSYVNTLNSMGLKTSKVSPQISVNTLNVFFDKLENTNHIEPRLNSEYHDNAAIQKFWRRIEFSENTKNSFDQELTIDEKVISTKSNLDSSVMRFLLYKLGFPLDAFDQYRGSIQKLLGYRNNISHGGKFATNDFKKIYAEINTEILEVMIKLKLLLVDGIKNKIYLDKVVIKS